MAFATLTRLTLCALWLGVPNLPAAAQSAGVSVGIVLDAGRPLRVSLDQRLTIKRVGQIIEATVLEPAYAHDRVVVPAGTQVRGRVASFEDVSKLTRARAMLTGNVTPLERPVLEFDTLILPAAQGDAGRAGATLAAIRAAVQRRGTSGRGP